MGPFSMNFHHLLYNDRGKETCSHAPVRPQLQYATMTFLASAASFAFCIMRWPIWREPVCRKKTAREALVGRKRREGGTGWRDGAPSGAAGRSKISGPPRAAPREPR